MSKHNDGGPAFPVGYNGSVQGGMSLRDYFAAKASDEDVACVLRGFVRDRQALPEERAIARFIHADNMLAERGENDGR